MSLGLVGRKVGMTRVFTDDGISIPVTVLEVVPNRVTQIKTIENGGIALSMITNRGIKVWPDGFKETFCTGLPLSVKVSSCALTPFTVALNTYAGLVTVAFVP